MRTACWKGGGVGGEGGGKDCPLVGACRAVCHVFRKTKTGCRSNKKHQVVATCYNFKTVFVGLLFVRVLLDITCRCWVVYFFRSHKTLNYDFHRPTYHSTQRGSAVSTDTAV